jgi:hypothetical protein
MPHQPPHVFAYVHTDVPEGMTIRDWRAQRAAERAAQQQAEREARRQRSVPRRIRSATGTRLVALRATWRAPGRAARA